MQQHDLTPETELPGIDDDLPLEGWHQRRWFWPVFWSVFFPALVYCLFPARPDRAVRPVTAEEPRATSVRAVPSKPAAPMAPIADLGVTPTAVLEGEIVVEEPIRTAIRPHSHGTAEQTIRQ